MCQGLGPSQSEKHAPANTNVHPQTEKYTLGNTNVHKQTGLGLEFSLDYQLKWLKKEKKCSLISLFMKAIIPDTHNIRDTLQ